MTETTANTQEARDFKVVVTLDNPPTDSSGAFPTARIQTAQKKNVLTIPSRRWRSGPRKNSASGSRRSSGGNVTLAAAKSSAIPRRQRKMCKVFLWFAAGQAAFVPVQTGISGVTDIEVISGLQEGDQIVTGSYKALRTLKPGAKIKVDNTVTARDEARLEDSSAVSSCLIREVSNQGVRVHGSRSKPRPARVIGEDLVAAGIVIQTEELWKTYEMGVERLHALRGV